MTQYVNPITRNGGVEQIVVPERVGSTGIDEAPFDDQQYCRVNGVWVPIDFPDPPAPVVNPAFVRFSGNGSTATTTSTSGVALGAAGAQGTFVAPASGVVLLMVSGQIKASVAGTAATLSYEVKAGATIGSGTTIDGHDVDRGPLNTNTEYVRCTMPFLVDDLTPGDTYNTRTVGISGSGSSTASFAHCRITIIPQP